MLNFILKGLSRLKGTIRTREDSSDKPTAMLAQATTFGEAVVIYYGKHKGWVDFEIDYAATKHQLNKVIPYQGERGVIRSNLITLQPLP